MKIIGRKETLILVIILLVIISNTGNVSKSYKHMCQHRTKAVYCRKFLKLSLHMHIDDWIFIGIYKINSILSKKFMELRTNYYLQMRVCEKTRFRENNPQI